MKVGESIRIVRTKVGIRQGELAARAGVSQSMLSLIETGRRQPSMALIQKLSEAMDVPAQLVFLLACEPAQGKEKYGPALQKLGAAMLELLIAVR